MFKNNVFKTHTALQYIAVNKNLKSQSKTEESSE